VAQLGYFLKTLVTWSLVVLAIYGVLFYGLRLLLRKWEKEIAIVTLNVSQAPLLAILILVGLKASILTLGDTKVVPWIERALSALIVVAATYWIAQLFTQVIAYYLKKYAQQSEAMWDDVLVPLLESTLPLLVYLMGGFLFLQTLGIDLTGLWVAFGGAAFVLGFALQDILANFFSGLVLLIDTPFQFGDVISLPNGSLAVIKKVGIRLTKLFMIDTHCDLYIPNGTLEGQDIINLSRPAPHYYYSLKIPLRADTEPAIAMSIIKEVVLTHPDTLGNIDEKLQILDKYYKFTTEAGTEFNERRRSKKETGRLRILAEKKVNIKLKEIQQRLKDLSEKIQLLEKGGLDIEESRNIQGFYLDIVKQIGLEVVAERQDKRRISWLEEAPEEETLINLVRSWYKAWSKDPDLTDEDPEILQEEWERKIELMKRRVNKLFQKIAQPKVDERKLDDYVIELGKWLNEQFKNVQTLWQAPKIWTDTVSASDSIASMEYVVKFYVDNIKLEQCQRGLRVKSEVQGELIRQLRQAYIYR
jgi:MscS family membrane protein